MERCHNFDLFLRNTKSKLQGISRVLNAIQKCSVGNRSNIMYLLDLGGIS